MEKELTQVESIFNSSVETRQNKLECLSQAKLLQHLRMEKELNQVDSIFSSSVAVCQK